jgi:hypothetical protein
MAARQRSQEYKEGPLGDDGLLLGSAEALIELPEALFDAKLR